MTDSGLILALDTATPTCSIALTSGELGSGDIVAALSLDSGVTHSRRLLGAIDQLFQQTDGELKMISAVGVGLGPGSFTGLRIGMATAKGLAHGAGLPLIGISSLDSIAVTIRDERLICVLLDARKKEVYARFYRPDNNGVARPCTDHVVLSPEKLALQIEEPVLMAGDGVDVYSEELEEILAGRMERAEISYPSAEMIGLLSGELYREKKFLDIAAAEPTYVRASDAELSLVRTNR